MSQYILYGYDYKTRELQGPRPAQLRPGGQPILTSGSATATASGLHKVGFAQVWRGVHNGSDWPHAHLTLDLAAQGDDGAWWYIDDHRQEMDTEGRLIEGTGTPYWLPAPCDEADDWRSEPRYVKELGPLPDGAVLERPEKPAPTQDELQSFFTSAIQQHMDDFAKTRNYDNIMSACTYATSNMERFRIEGQYCVEARDATWAAGYALMEAVLSGQRGVPSLEEVFAVLPKLAWPA